MAPLISPLTLRSLSSTTVPINLLSPHCILCTPHLTQCSPYTNILLCTTPFPSCISNIRNNVTIMLFRDIYQPFAPPSPSPPCIFMSLPLGSALRWIHFVNPRRELKSIRDPLRCSRRTLGSLPARLPPRNWNLTNGLRDLGPKRLLLVAMHLSLS